MRYRELMRSVRLALLAICLLVPSLHLTAQTFKLPAITFTGAPAFSQDDLLKLSGLHPGGTSTQAEVQAAAQHLSDTGLFADIHFESNAKGLVYTINHFKEQVGDKFNVKDIAANMNSLVKEAVQSLNNFRAITAGNDFQIAFHPILDVRTGAVHHYEALVRFNGNFEESPYKYITFAEETGLITEFDIAMARKSVRRS